LTEVGFERSCTMAEIIPASQVRTGMVIMHDGEPHKVVNFRFSMQGRGSNTIPCKMKNLITGAGAEYRFRSDDKIERAYIEEQEVEFLYNDADEYWFMNNENYEQMAIQKEDLEDVLGYLLPNTLVKVQIFDGKAIGVTLPTTVQMEVVETEPVIKGATASGNVTKPATLTTGLVIQVPMFVAQGDTVIVNTVTGEYSGRPGKQ